MKNYIIIILTLQAFCLNVGAQEKLKGRVVDAQTQEPLAGATIKVLQAAQTTTTNNDGYFELNLPKGEYQLSITYLSYHTEEQQISIPFVGNLLISLHANENSLQEVNVVRTGYQTLPKERATGSFSKVDQKAFERQVSVDVLSRLKATAPSLLFDERSGNTRLSLRGRSTIFANDQPLIVLDGFPYDGDLYNINPNEVESINLLKDAAAASIWGVRAGNGVIVITTKKATQKQQPTVEVNANYMVSAKPDLNYPSQMTTVDFIAAERLWFDNGLYNADLNNTTTYAPISLAVSILDKKKRGLITSVEAETAIAKLQNNNLNNDLLKYFYKSAMQQQLALSLSGASAVHQYRFAAGYDRGQMTEIGNSKNRISLKTTQSLQLLKKLKLTIDANLFKVDQQRNNTLAEMVTGGPSGKILSPYTNLFDEQGNAQAILKDYQPLYKQYMEQQGLRNWDYLPLRELSLVNNKEVQQEVRLNTGLQYQIVKNLAINLNYLLETQQRSGTNLKSDETYFTRNLINRYSSINGAVVDKRIPDGGIVDYTENTLNRNSIRMQLQFAKTFNKYDLNILGGVEVRELLNDTRLNRDYGYDENLGTSIAINANTTYQLLPNGSALIPNTDHIGQVTERYRSYYANGAYSFDKRYVFSLSGRVDQSNFFGVAANQRSVPLWSAGFKWNLSNEHFYKSVLLPKIGFRFTYGFNGNLDRSVTAYTTASISNSITTGQPAASILSPPNSNLSWERVAILNIAADFGFYNNRVNGSIEYYNKKGKNLIGQSPLDATVGLASYRGNVASMAANGIDIELNGQIFNTKQLSLQTNIFFSYTADKITAYHVIPNFAAYFADGSLNANNASQFAPTIGRPLFGVYSRKWAGLNAVNGNPMGYVNGLPSDNYAQLLTAVGKTVDSLVYHGRVQAPFFGALRNTFSYQNWSLSFNISYRFGYYFRANYINYNTLFTRGIGHADYAKRWQVAGDEQFTNVPSAPLTMNTNRDNFYASSSVNVHKGDHIRLQDLNIEFTVPSTKSKKSNIKNLRLFSYANNLMLLWRANKIQLDPDYPNRLPLRTYALGFKCSL